ncbi:VRR-NUC domain-containing protein [Candidatus Pacearchaeota archaeon]|nr:VRR-NUC domain-containing protein [Candidatus Pacearchaeota archaeon]
MSESTEQQLTVSWCRLQYPKYRIIAIPNGAMIGGRNKYVLIKKYKAEGMTNGVSDLLLCVARKGYYGLWIEMKDKGKTACSVSEDQEEWFNDMREAGYKAEWAAGFEQAKKIIEEYLS